MIVPEKPHWGGNKVCMLQYVLGVVIVVFASSDPATVKILNQSDTRTTSKSNPSNADHVIRGALKGFSGKSRETTRTQKKPNTAGHTDHRHNCSRLVLCTHSIWHVTTACEFMARCGVCHRCRALITYTVIFFAKPISLILFT